MTDDDIELVTTLQVRNWAVAQGLIDDRPGRLLGSVIAAYEEAHPNHLHSRYAHGPGGYDKGCKCDVCKAAKGIGLRCRSCTNRKKAVTEARMEVARIARGMARGPRSEERLRPALDAAKAELEKAKRWQAEHDREEHAA